MKKYITAALITGILFMSAAIDSSDATTIVLKSFEQVVQGSELIFEGKVISKETRLSTSNDMPFTYFLFEIIDIVIGDYTGSTIELGFMGGLKGDMILEISDMTMPEMGERGIYFVTNQNKLQMHPLSGWHQGHYLVVDSINRGVKVAVPVKNKEAIKNLSKAARLLTVEDFKNNIRYISGKEQ